MAAPTIDGYANSGNSFLSSPTGTVTLSTSNSGDVIILQIAFTGTSLPPTVITISSSNTTGWTKRTAYTANNGAAVYLNTEIWYGFAAAPLVSEVITVTASAAPSSASGGASIEAFGIYSAVNAYTSNPFDINGSLPGTSFDVTSGFPGTIPQVTGLSTSGTTPLVLAFYSSLENLSETAGGSATLLDANVNGFGGVNAASAVEYETTTLSTSTVAFGSDAFHWTCIVDAVINPTPGISGQFGASGTITEPDDVMHFRENPRGSWTSTEADDGMYFGPIPAVDTYAKNGTPGSGGPGTTATGTVTLTTHFPSELILLYSVAGSLNSQGYITSITDTAGLTWHRRNTRILGGIRPVAELWWAIAPNRLSGDVITVNYSPAVGAVDLWAVGVVGANNSAPFDTHTFAGGVADNFTNGNPTAVISTFANTSLIFAFYAGLLDVAHPGEINSPFTYVDDLNTAAPSAGTLYSDFSYYYAGAPQTNLTAQYGQFGGSATSRGITFDSVVARGETGTADEIRWFLDAGAFSGGNAFFTGEFINGDFTGTTTLYTYNADDMIIVAAMLQNASGVGEITGITIQTGTISPGFTRRSRVTDASGTLAFEVWWAWAPSALTTPLTVTCSGVANNSDILSFIAFAVNGANMPGFAPDWDPDVSLPATAFSDSAANVQVPSVYTESPNTLQVAFTGNMFGDTVGTETTPYLPGYHFTSGAPVLSINFEYYFSAPVVSNQTAKWTFSANPAVWAAIADAIDVGPPSPPVGTWASTEHADKMTGAPAQSPYLSIGWLGWVPAFLTMSLTERKDFPTGAPVQAPYDSIGWLGWVPLYFTWVSVEFDDRFIGHAWVLGQPLTGQWHSTEHDDLTVSPWATPPTGTMTITETDDRWASAGFELPTAIPAPQRSRRVVIVT